MALPLQSNNKAEELKSGNAYLHPCPKQMKSCGKFIIVVFNNQGMVCLQALHGNRIDCERGLYYTGVSAENVWSRHPKTPRNNEEGFHIASQQCQSISLLKLLSSSLLEWERSSLVSEWNCKMISLVRAVHIAPIVKEFYSFCPFLSIN